jgi:hypothetical protein
MSDIDLFEGEDDAAYDPLLEEEAEKVDNPYFIGDTFEPESGENAVIIQPGGRVPAFVTVRNVRTGLSFTEDHLPVDVESGAAETQQEFLGGEPLWLQRSESPGFGWRLIGQLTDR